MSSSDDLGVERHFLVNQDPEYDNTCDKPKHPQYALVAQRKESYKKWPSSTSPLEIEDLVDAGLVYTGVGDSVRCFYCNGCLRNWEPGDSPWEEHAKWYPSCPFLLLVKGQEYVDGVLHDNTPDQDGPGSETSTPKERQDGVARMANMTSEMTLLKIALTRNDKLISNLRQEVNDLKEKLELAKQDHSEDVAMLQDVIREKQALITQMTTKVDSLKFQIKNRSCCQGAGVPTKPELTKRVAIDSCM